MSDRTISRRKLLAASATAGVVATGGFETNAADGAANRVSLSKDDVILFQGDSITDAGRDRNHQDKPNHPAALGRGYPFHISGPMLAENPKLDLKFFNRGLSGHKVPQLDGRWQADTLDLKPAIVSILVGVNDIWHKLNGKYDGTAEVYRDGFAALLERTRKALPKVTLVVCEPFVLRCGAVNDTWFPEFDQRREFAKTVATEAGAIWVPFQEMFDAAVKAGTAPEYWAADGVHPTHAGHALMARTWRESVGV
jgi:lysophospholipase L1-like esterase